MNTYHVNVNTAFLPIMPDLSAQSNANQIAGSPYLKGHTAVLAIYNNVGSGRKVTINNFNVTDLTSGNASLNIGANPLTQYTLDIVKISGFTSGISVPINKFDFSSGTTLPSQIVAYRLPPTVAQYSTSKFRRLPTDTNIGSDATSVFGVIIFSRLMGAKMQMLNSCGGYNNYGDTGQTSQNLILREGEGISLVPNTFATVSTVIYHYTIQFRVGSQFYFINDTVSVGSQPAFCLFNNSGSGVVLQIIDVDVCEGGFTTDPVAVGIGVENYLNIFSLEPIYSLRPNSIEVNSGTTTTVIPYDSTSESLTGLVEIRTNTPVNIGDDKGGEVIIMNNYRRTPQVSFSNGADSGTLMMNFKTSGKDQMNAIVLNEGQGIAVIKRSVGGYGHSNIDLVFSTTTVSSVGESFSGYV